MNAATEKQFAALIDMFRKTHNVPSTPIHSIQGHVREKTIWGYWAQGEQQMPPLFRGCVQTWQRFNPTWSICILAKDTVLDYLSEAELPNRWAEMTSHQTVSDAVRLALLCRYGGCWVDVNIILRIGLDELCWNDIASGKVPAAAFFHPYYGTSRLGGEDFTESWFLATRSGNPFFLLWRDMLKEILHNRLDVDGISYHPLYQDIDLSGFNKLNKEYGGPTLNFREYLVIHVMCHRLLETDKAAFAQWQRWKRFNAADSAFKLQLACDKADKQLFEAFISNDPQWDKVLEGVPLIKLRTPDYAFLLMTQFEQLVDKKKLIGRLLLASP